MAGYIRNIPFKKLYNPIIYGDVFTDWSLGQIIAFAFFFGLFDTSDAIASSSTTKNGGINAFDGSLTNYWECSDATVANTSYIGWDFIHNKIRIDAIIYYPNQTVANNVRGLKVQGSNVSGVWEDLAVLNNIPATGTFWIPIQYKKGHAEQGYYKYRLLATTGTGATGTSNGHWRVNEIVFLMQKTKTFIYEEDIQIWE